jgi:hypothetical protein
MINGFSPAMRFDRDKKVIVNREIEELKRIERVKDNNKNPTEEQKNLYARSIQRRVRTLMDLGLTRQEILDLE